jgi:hypothetical protein
LAKKAKKKEEDVDAYRHETETRKNVVPVGLASYDTSKQKPKKYEYDPHLDNIKQQFLTANNQEMNLHITLPGAGKPIEGGKGQLWCLTLQIPTLNI